jgi:signal transduction histidine kinase
MQLEGITMNLREKVNILMVDDQAGKLLSYEAILADLGENLIKAHSAREALDLLLKTEVAIVLMDVSMPEFDGFELAHMIRQHPRFQETAIIFISGVYLSDLDRLKAYERGAVDYISVPIVPELLRAKVRVFADLHRKNRQMEQLNYELRTLSARLISTQDEERRRIARELHDGVGQLVAALSMNNGLLQTESQKLRPEALEALRQNSALVDQLSREIRTVSHLLHPPLLDDVGLLPAIKSYAEGFSARSDVKVSVELSPELGRLAPIVEISIFRIVQECLTNIYRHSGSKTATIRIWPTDDNQLTVQVTDEGKGLPVENHLPGSAAKNHGMGLSGMRERVRELGGRLKIDSSEKGTTVIAAFPLIGAVAIGA